MPVIPSQFEQVDKRGTSIHFNGSVGTTAIDVPTVAGNPIVEFLIENMHANQNILVSVDGGVLFKTVRPGVAIAWSLKGGILQVKVKAAGAATTFEMLINRETESGT